MAESRDSISSQKRCNEKVQASKDQEKASFLTVVYLLQSNKHVVVVVTPAYHCIRILTISHYNIIIDNSDIYVGVWKSHCSNWKMFMRTIICPDIIRPFGPLRSAKIF